MTVTNGAAWLHVHLWCYFDPLNFVLSVVLSISHKFSLHWCKCAQEPRVRLADTNSTVLLFAVLSSVPDLDPGCSRDWHRGWIPPHRYCLQLSKRGGHWKGSALQDAAGYHPTWRYVYCQQGGKVVGVRGGTAWGGRVRTSYLSFPIFFFYFLSVRLTRNVLQRTY